MSDGESGSVSYLYDNGHVMPINSSNVNQISSITSATGYGKSDATDKTGARGTPKNGYVEVTIDGSKPDQIKARWVAGAAVFNSTEGDLILTGNAISNGSIKDQIQSLGVDPSSIKTITAADGSRIDDNTPSIFAGLSNLQKVDLSKAKLEHSSYDMLADLPDSVQEIVLPDSSSSYNIRGTWYDSKGNKLDNGNWAPKGHNKNEYSRIYKDQFPAGSAIYRSAAAAKAHLNLNSIR